MSQQIQKLWSERFKITSILVNPMGRLGLYGVLNLLQETAWMHAETLGFGMKDMEHQGLFWVLTRQSLQMNSWPRLGQHITIETWLRPPEGAFVAREFFLKDDKGNILGSCATSWLALDRKTKKVLPSKDLRPWDEICLEQSNGLIAEKIPVQGAYEMLAKFRVRNSDLDTNQHVNNTKYSQWILDSIPYDLHKSLILKSYTVNFLAETHLGDKVKVERSCASPSHEETSSGSTTYRGTRLEDDKILFTARLEWEKI